MAGGGRERVIDLNVFIDMEGHLCICETCGREIAALLGFITTEERDEALAHAASMATEVERLSRERDEAVTLVNDVLRFREEHAEPEPEPVPAAAPRRTTKVRSA